MFGQTLLEEEMIWTSEGFFVVSMSFQGRNEGQNMSDRLNRDPDSRFIDRLSNGQQEAINNILNRYQNSAGDTYFFWLFRNNIDTFVVVEMTSPSRWVYWAYRLL